MERLWCACIESLRLHPMPVSERSPKHMTAGHFTDHCRTVFAYGIVASAHAPTNVAAGSYILKGGPVDEAQMLLDDHLVKVQAMMASPFAKPFETELVPWERKLNRLQGILDNCTTPPVVV
jgi:hypothetical protein